LTALAADKPIRAVTTGTAECLVVYARWRQCAPWTNAWFPEPTRVCPWLV